MDGYDVCRPDEVDVESLDVILVSSDCWEEELSNRVVGLWGGRIEIVRLYDGLPRGPYDKTDDREETLRCLSRLAPTRPVESRLVVIVSDQSRSREAKIGHALRETGWRPVLLHCGKPTFDTSRFFDSVRQFGHEWEALRCACDYSPVVYHMMVRSTGSSMNSASASAPCRRIRRRWKAGSTPFAQTPRRGCIPCLVHRQP